MSTFIPENIRFQKMSKINMISVLCLTTIIFCTISADTGYSLSKLKTIIMNAYNDEPTLHSKICRTDVSSYSGQLWGWDFHDITANDSLVMSHNFWNFGLKNQIPKKEFIDQIICRNSVYKHLILNKVSNIYFLTSVVAENVLRFVLAEDANVTRQHSA